MSEGKPEVEATLVERWLQDQQQWQRTLLTYFDSMVKNEQFLIHLGNAMRGSLLAGKPYPTPPTGAEPAPTAADNRLDEVLFALHTLQGQLQDLFMTLEDIRQRLASVAPPAAGAAAQEPVKRPGAPRAAGTKRRARR